MGTESIAKYARRKNDPAYLIILMIHVSDRKNG